MALVVAVPDPDAPAVLQHAVISLRPNPDGLECTCRSFDLLLALHMGVDGDGLATVVQRETIGRALLQRKASNVEKSRHHVSHASGDVVLGALRLVVLQVL